MTYTQDADPLCYAGTEVLKNIPQITDQSLLDGFEAFAFENRAAEPWEIPLNTAKDYRALHQHLFQDIYEWAGQYRTIRIGKGGNWFCYPEHIDAEMQCVFGYLEHHNSFADMNAEAFAKHASHFVSELNAVHPFREGNGRTQNTGLIMLASNAGFSFDTSTWEKDAIIPAMIASFHGDETLLETLILKAIE